MPAPRRLTRRRPRPCTAAALASANVAAGRSGDDAWAPVDGGEHDRRVYALHDAVRALTERGRSITPAATLTRLLDTLVTHPDERAPLALLYPAGALEEIRRAHAQLERPARGRGSRLSRSLLAPWWPRLVERALADAERDGVWLTPLLALLRRVERDAVADPPEGDPATPDPRLAEWERGFTAAIATATSTAPLRAALALLEYQDPGALVLAHAPAHLADRLAIHLIPHLSADTVPPFVRRVAATAAGRRRLDDWLAMLLALPTASGPHLAVGRTLHGMGVSPSATHLRLARTQLDIALTRARAPSLTSLLADPRLVRHPTLVPRLARLLHAQGDADITVAAAFVRHAAGPLWLAAARRLQRTSPSALALALPEVTRDQVAHLARADLAWLLRLPRRETRLAVARLLR